MLAQIMAITAIAVLVWIICLALDKKLVGYLVVLVAVFTIVSMVAEKIAPTVHSWQDKKAKVERFIDKMP